MCIVCADTDTLPVTVRQRIGKKGQTEKVTEKQKWSGRSGTCRNRHNLKKVERWVRESEKEKDK